jgi:hypothetical protein
VQNQQLGGRVYSRVYSSVCPLVQHIAEIIQVQARKLASGWGGACEALPHIGSRQSTILQAMLASESRTSARCGTARHTCARRPRPRAASNDLGPGTRDAGTGKAAREGREERGDPRLIRCRPCLCATRAGQVCAGEKARVQSLRMKKF